MRVCDWMWVCVCGFSEPSFLYQNTYFHLVVLFACVLCAVCVSAIVIIVNFPSSSIFSLPQQSIRRDVLTFAHRQQYYDVRKSFAYHRCAKNGWHFQWTNGMGRWNVSRRYSCVHACACCAHVCVRIFLSMFTISRAQNVYNFRKITSKKKTFSSSVCPLPCNGKIEFRKDL